jgi:hypothetical protein
MLKLSLGLYQKMWRWNNMNAKPYYQTVLPILLLIAAFWWGEGGGGIDAIMSACIAALLVSVVVFFTQLKRVFKVLAYLFLSALFIGAFIAGQASSGRAFNECVEHGNDARAKLQAYFLAHQSYPATLYELNQVPCNRILRASILSYQPTKQGYQLYFGDSFVSFTATESKPFEAHK